MASLDQVGRFLAGSLSRMKAALLPNLPAGYEVNFLLLVPGKPDLTLIVGDSTEIDLMSSVGHICTAADADVGTVSAADGIALEKRSVQ